MMATELHTFMDIFQKEFTVGIETVKLEKIVVPIIQRDYAQGRKDDKVKRVRDRFLDSLYAAINSNPITLDFIYGDISPEGVMTPLDGQQRLTTLFLLHWYAAKHDQVPKEEYAFLSNFSYETRYSARDFCSELIDFEPTFAGKLSDEIEDQAWFPLDWEKDPTISGMLVMLDAIDEKFKAVDGLWNALKGGCIQFYFLPVKDMGLTDELYIKMNSRGKPLTNFEHFKAELEHELKKADGVDALAIIRKIDIDWTDMLWEYRGEDNIIDDEFLRYFNFVCDIIRYKAGLTPQGRSNDEFDLLKECFDHENPNIKANIDLLQQYFDCWCKLNGSRDDFFGKFMSKEHEPGKIRIENRYEINIFKDCLNKYGLMIGTTNNRQFPLGRIALLYAVIAYITHMDTVSEVQFARRLRIVNNLISNSNDEVSDSESRQGGNRMPAILKQIDSIMIDGVIRDDIEINFNVAQLAEEKEKLVWAEEHPELAEALFSLEDHDLLQGQIGIVGLDHPENFRKFDNLFKCDWDLVNCALLTIGNYGYREKNQWRFTLGARSRDSAWKILFHKSSNGNFETTKACLGTLLSKAETFTNEFLQGLIDDYLKLHEQTQEFDWRYYYIKYPIFRPNAFGRYCLDGAPDSYYEMRVLTTAGYPSTNSYQGYLAEVDKASISRDDYGICLINDNRKIFCTKDGYEIRNAQTNVPEAAIHIEQNKDGSDRYDRIQKFKELYARAKNHMDLVPQITDIPNIVIEKIDPDEIDSGDSSGTRQTLPRIDSLLQWGVVKAGDILVAKDRADEAELLADGNVKCADGEKTIQSWLKGVYGWPSVQTYAFSIDKKSGKTLSQLRKEYMAEHAGQEHPDQSQSIL